MVWSSFYKIGQLNSKKVARGMILWYLCANMTLNELKTLNEDEAMMLLGIFNIIYPSDLNIQLTLENLTWIKKDVFNKKVIDAFQRVNLPSHKIYSSLLTKLNIEHSIQYTTNTANTQSSGSI